MWSAWFIKNLKGANGDLLRPDDVHHNNIGLDIFNIDLQYGVEQALAAVGCSSVKY